MVHGWKLLTRRVPWDTSARLLDGVCVCVCVYSELTDAFPGDSYGDSKGRSLVSKDIHTRLDPPSSLVAARKGGERRVGSTQDSL